LKANPGKAEIWTCDYCESKGLQEARNCERVLDGQCRQHGLIKFEDLEEDETSGKLKCPICNSAVQMPFQLRLGKRYWLWSCPIQQVDISELATIRLVNWAEAIGQTPSGKPLYDESNLYFEIREFILQEQHIAQEELEELSPKKDQAGASKIQGVRPRAVPKRVPRRR
jgi:hypothetical protein